MQHDETIVVPQDNWDTIAWETEFEPIFDKPIPYQDHNVIDLRATSKKNTPNNPENQLTDNGLNLSIYPLNYRTTVRDVVQSTPNKQNFDLASDSHPKDNQARDDSTKTTNTDEMNVMPSISETNDVQDESNTSRRKFNLRCDSNPIFSDIYRY